MKFDPATKSYKLTTTEQIRVAIKEAMKSRDALPDHDMDSWFFFNGKVTALSDLLRDLKWRKEWPGEPKPKTKPKRRKKN